jgi:outer membrane lipoprotein-sorting protein
MLDPRPLTAALIIGLACGSAFAQADARALPPKRPELPAPAGPPDIKAPPAIGGVQPVAAKAATAAAPSQQEALQRVNSYLNKLRVMSGSFTQVNPDGTRSTGKFWISKPGKLRFQYAPPSPVELVADGRSVAIRDRKLNTQDLYLIGQTPLRFLLADNIDLVSDTRVAGVSVEPDWVNVVLEEKSSIGGNARIQLMFSGTDYSLKQWTVTDAQGYDTTVAIFDTDTSSKPPDKLFYINEQRTL